MTGVIPSRYRSTRFIASRCLRPIGVTSFPGSARFQRVVLRAPTRCKLALPEVRDQATVAGINAVSTVFKSTGCKITTASEGDSMRNTSCEHVRFDSHVSRHARRFPSGCAVHVARLTHSILGFARAYKLGLRNSACGTKVAAPGCGFLSLRERTKVRAETSAGSRCHVTSSTALTGCA
jgi:hypothetical protein